MPSMSDDNRALTYCQMREENLFTDAEVKSSSGREWPVHKVVMSRVGKFFSNAFTFPSFSGTLDLGVVDGVVEAIIDFAYRGRGACQINYQANAENVLEVLSAAFMYQLESLIEVCVSFVMNNMITFEHVLALKVFVRDHEVEMKACMDGALIHIVDNFIARNFNDLILNEDVYNLSVEDLVALVKRDDLNIAEEELVYFVLFYYEANQLNFEKAKQLLYHVRLGLIDSPKLDQIADGSETLRNQMEAFLEALRNEMETSMEANSDQLPRYPRDIVLVIGQNHDKEIFNIRKNEWKQVQLNGIRPNVILGNILYEIEFLDDQMTKIKSFDIKNGHYMPEKQSQIPYEHEIDEIEQYLAWNGGILAFLFHENFFGALFYYPKENRWALFPARQYATYVVVNGVLFAIGGYIEDNDDDQEEEGEEYNYLSRNIEYFETRTSSWVVCGYLREKPGYLKVGVVGGKFYVISMDEKYAECFQPFWANGMMRLNSFSNINLPRGNINSSVSVLDNKIMITGGIFGIGEDDPEGRKQSHIFCPRMGVWSRAADLHGFKTGQTALTINTSEFEVERIQQICDGQLVVSDNDQEV